MAFTKFKLLTERLKSGLGLDKTFFPFYDSETDVDYKVRLNSLIEFISDEIGTSSRAIFELTGVTNVSNAYSSSLSLINYLTEGVYIFQPNIDSSGNSTLNVTSTGLGDLPIKKFDGTILVSVDDLKTTNTYLLAYKSSDLGYWQIIGGSGGSGTSLTDKIRAGEDLAVRDIVYLRSDGKYKKADNLVEYSCSTELRIVTSTAILNDASGYATRIGLVTGFPALSTGELYYVGTNGAISLYNDIPDTEGIIVRSVGTAKSATELEFNPEDSYIVTTQERQVGIKRIVTSRNNETTTLGSVKVTDYVENCTGDNFLTFPTAVGNSNKYTINLRGGTTTLYGTGIQTLGGLSSIVISTPPYPIGTVLDFMSDNVNWVIV